ncbi:hypothetical protein JVW24_23635, partial [Vibrio cholerae O1]|nr:hypothetical protein [Vibrio cholerae O1]
GQHYVSDGIVPAEPGDEERGRSDSEPTTASAGARFSAASPDPDLDHVPSTRPGSPLPHAWVDRDRQRLSTLDLVGSG